MIIKRGREVLELHDNAPKRVTTHHAAVIEIEMIKGFHLEPGHGGDNHNGAPKRVTVVTGVAAAGVEVLGFRWKNLRNTTRYLGPSTTTKPGLQDTN